MALNVDLMLEIREQITSHPETHDQNVWGYQDSCGTTHCIAGWASALTGAHLDWRKEFGATQLVHADDEDPDDYARRVMGLDGPTAQRLFFECNNCEALTLLDELIEQGKNAA